MPPVMEIKYQDPGETLDYPVDWLPTLQRDGGTISSAPFGAPGLTIVAQQKTDTNATVWLAGVELDTTYIVTCTMVGTNGLTYVHSFKVRGIEK